MEQPQTEVDYRLAFATIKESYNRACEAINGLSAVVVAGVNNFVTHVYENIAVPIITALQLSPLQDALRHQRMVKRAVRKLPVRRQRFVVPARRKRVSSRRAMVVFRKLERLHASAGLY